MRFEVLRMGQNLHTNMESFHSQSHIAIAHIYIYIYIYIHTVYVVYLAVILIWWFGELQVNRQILVTPF